MTSELRPAVEVWEDAVHANLTTPDEPYGASADAAAAVIEADREAVRAEVVRDIVAWLRTKDNYDFDDLAIDIEAKFGETGND